MIKISIKTILFSLICLNIPILAVAQQKVDTTQKVNKNTKNSIAQQQKPYVILISADGFRYDYATKYNATNLLMLSKNGVQAESMIPSYPSVTFPNHYTIVTGLYPSHHGLVNNTFYDKNKNAKYSMSAKDKVNDGSWYGGTPIWVLAEQQKMLAANMFWVGSEAEIKQTKSTYYYNYNEEINLDKRIQIVKDWLMLPEERRPHLITFYIDEPDHTSHDFGPDAPETAKVVKMVDSAILKLTEAVKTTGLPVNFIFLSDHGMTTVDRENPIPLPKEIDSTKFSTPTVGTMVDIQAKNKADIMPLYNQLKQVAKDYEVYLKADVPAQLHYSTKDDNFDRIGDIILLPNWPKVFSKRKPKNGYHGFEPLKVKDMHATFFAWGPAFKQQIKIPSFENVNVYPLIAQILGLKITEEIDGKKEILINILK